MSIQSTTRAALAGIIRRSPEAAVAVSYKGKSCSGLRDRTAQASATTGMGNKGETTGTVRVDASLLDMPEKGDTLSVGGVTVFAGECRLDAVGAILMIDYSNTRPFTGEA